MIGQSIAHYDIVAELGAGGMGVVYRARDTRLGREVAIKALPTEFAADEHRLARFESEARILASLSHPHIGAIYGLERIDDQSFLILELIEGESLADVIRRNPIPPREALRLSIQMAEALACAHEAGVIHRDLKPANLRIDPLGQVKILDFGLAKATVPADAQPIATTDSPTEPDLATAAGVIMGTAPYMSPEQARGQSIDERTDIWAFGCVLFEMLTGRRTFGGPTRSDITAAVLSREPDWDELPSGIPPRLRQVLGWCLAKEPRQRLRSMGDALLLLGAIAENPSESDGAVSEFPRRSRWRLSAAAAAALGLGLGLLVGVFGSNFFARLPALQMLELPMAPPHGLKPSLGYGPSLAISPDGTHLAFVLETGTTTMLYLKGPDELEARPLNGTSGARTPFFSPTGEWIAFFDERDRKLKKISVGGGEPVPVVDADTAWGGDWGADGSIVFTSSRGGIVRIPATGGEPERLTEVGSWPELLPGGEVMIFTIDEDRGSYDEAKVVAMPLAGGAHKIILESAYYPHYSPTGHLIFVQGDSVLAAPFDLESLEVTGPAVTVLEQVWTSSWIGYSDFAFSDTGNLIYISGGPNANRARLVSVNRAGVSRALLDVRRPYRVPRLSPDGKNVALTIADEQVDVWIYDLNRESLSRLTDSGSWDAYPQWRPGMDSIAFASMKAGRAAIYLRDLRRGTDERLFESENSNFPSSWSRDGTRLAYTAENPKSGSDIWVYSLSSKTQEPFLATSYTESNGEFSPNGRYIAYESDETGRQNEIYIRPYPEGNPRLQVSTDGGRVPRWSAGGAEIYYWVGGRLMAVPLTFDPELTAGTPTKLFEGPYGYSYDVAPDGQSFLMVEEMADADPPMRFNFVANWFEQLKVAARAGS